MKSNYKQYKWDGYSWRYRENTYDISDLKMSKEKLLSTKWVIELQNQWDFWLVFYTDDVFKFGGTSAGVLVTGKYEVKNDSVKLYPQESEVSRKLKDILIDDFDWLAETELTGHMNYSSDNILYAHELLINQHVFYPWGVYKADGAEGLTDNVPVIKELETIVMTKTIPFYKQPDIKSPKIKNWKYGEQYDFVSEELVAGTPLQLLGKTKNKSSVQGKSDYWYYVIIYYEESHDYGWFFGNNFEVYQKEKDEIYKENLKAEIKKLKNSESRPK